MAHGSPHGQEDLKQSLLEEGYQVEAAGDILQAIKKVKDERFEIGIIDLEFAPMQGVVITGWDLIRIFRAFNPAIDLILVSADELDGVMLQAAQLDRLQVLGKPVDLSRLKAIVRSLDR